MKTLKHLDFQLQIDSDSLKIDNEKNKEKIVDDCYDYCYNLKLKTKHICNYIERTCLKKLKFEVKDYNGIVITFLHGYPEEKMSNIDESYITLSKCVGIFIRFDKAKYDSLKTDNEFREFIYEYMVDTFKKIEAKYEIPSSEMLASYKELKEKNFVNEWLGKKKTDTTRKLLAELHCAVTIDKFILTLKLYQDKVEIYNNVILETVPDEYRYAHRVKKLVIEQDAIKVLGTRDKITFSLPLKDILK
ncbi:MULTISPECIES: hypothetical protein [unclassified Lacinutrix]